MSGMNDAERFAIATAAIKYRDAKCSGLPTFGMTESQLCREEDHLSECDVYQARRALFREIDRARAAVVESFDLNTLRGTVLLRDGRRARFHSTSFQANTMRWPRPGEMVEVVFTKSGDLLSVHAL